MNLAFVNRMAGITRGGGEIWDLKMAEGLEERGADVTFYVGKPLRSELPEPIEDFETVEIPTPHLRDWAYAAPKGIGGALSHVDAEVFCRRVARELQKRGHDLVQISGRPHFARYVDRIDAPVSIVMHGEPYSLWYDVIKPWGSTYALLEKFNQVITISGLCEAIEKRVSCPVTAINPGVETDEFTPANIGEMVKNEILFVGRFVPAKNLDLLIKAFSIVYKNHFDTELVLVGDGPRSDALREKVQHRGISDRVRFTGYISNDNLPQTYKNANIFVLSSVSESYPLTLLEAMSCGTPVIAPSIGSIPEIIDNKKNGLVYKKGSVSELSKYMDFLLSNTKMQQKYGRAARTKAVNTFGWDRKQKQLYQLYRCLINE